MQNIVSGIQCTGNLHLGNYLGSIKNWIALQQQSKSFLFLADSHSITVKQDPTKLYNDTYKTVATYLACGIDPNCATIFAQSSVKEHAELAWILSCITPVGWLNRMIQFKEKAGKDKETAALGLYSYPVLMSADILLYQANIVPVGEDQKQHLELARDIAMAFNRTVKKDFFTIPEPLITGSAVRIMSLRDGRKKMSKSDESDYSRINLSDNADLIAKKIKKAKSDSFTEITYNEQERPEVANLINIYAALSNMNRDQVVENFSNHNFSSFKNELVDLAVATIEPISEKLNRFNQDKSYLQQVLKQGQFNATAVASKTINQVKQLLGFVTI